MRAWIFLAGMLVFACAAGAEEETKASRFAVEPSGDGFIRLDSQTGAVSHCGKRGDIWFCDPLTENESGLQHRLDVLSAKVDALTRQVAELAQRLAPAKPPGNATVSVAPSAPPAARPMSFSERLMRRFFALVREMKGASAGS